MELVDAGPFTVVGFPVSAEWEELWSAMPRAWQTLHAREREIANRVDRRLMDLSLDRIGDLYLQFLGASVTHPLPLPEGMQALRIPRQRYLYHRHHGPIGSIAESFGKMYDWAGRERVPVGEFKVDIGYVLDKASADGPVVAHDLYIGVLPLERWADITEDLAHPR